MEIGRGPDAVAAFQRMLSIEAAVCGLTFQRAATLRTHLRLCAAALLAGNRDMALDTMRRVVGRCCPPKGALSAEDVGDLCRRYGFGNAVGMQHVLAEALLGLQQEVHAE